MNQIKTWLRNVWAAMRGKPIYSAGQPIPGAYRVEYLTLDQKLALECEAFTKQYGHPPLAHQSPPTAPTRSGKKRRS